MAKVSAIAVFRDGKQHGVILQEDVKDFINSLFTQPDGATLVLVKTSVEPHLIGSPISRRKERPASKIDDLVGKSGK